MKFVKNKKAYEQIIRFGVVGVASTVIDLLLFNIGVLYLNYPVLVANVISATLATVFNYLAHSRWTFQTEEDEERKNHLVAYLLVTTSSIYVIQNLVLYVLTDVWKLPVSQLVNIIQQLNLVPYSSTALSLMVAKLGSLAVGATWSFVLYRKFVFVNNKKTTE